MKWVFVGTLLLAIALSVIANVTKPKEVKRGVVTLVWATDDNPARQEQMALFRQWYKEHYHEDIDIKIDPSNGGLEKVVIQSITGAGADLFDYNGGETLERFVKSGVILDVTEDAKKMHFTPDMVWEGVRPSIVYDGRQYAFPDNVANQLMIYHKDVFDKLGVPYPKLHMSWQEFYEMGKKLSFKDKKGLRHFAITSVDPLTMIYSNGAQMYSKDGTKCTFNSKEAIEALEFYRKMQSEHIIPTASDIADQAASGGWGTGDLTMFGMDGDKYFACAIAGRWWSVLYSKMVRDKGKQIFNIGVTTIPKFQYDYCPGSARGTGVNRNSPNKKYAVRFLEYLASDTFNRQINRSYDSLCGVEAYCKNSRDLSDGLPAPKGMEFVNDPLWIKAMDNAVEAPRSPFIPPYRTVFYWGEARGKFDADPNMTAKQMLDEFATNVNDEIQRNIQKDPKLHALYQQVTSGKGVKQ